MLVVAGPAPHLFYFLSHDRHHGVIRQQAAARTIVVNNISQANGFHGLPPRVPEFGASVLPALERKGESGRIMTQETSVHKQQSLGSPGGTGYDSSPKKEGETA